MFKVGDRVVVVKNLLGGPNTSIGQRGEVLHIEDTVLGVEVKTKDYGPLMFMPGELEFEETYDLMSAPHPDEVVCEGGRIECVGDGYQQEGYIFLTRELQDEMMEVEGEDVVNHPSHYADGWSNSAEVIDITEHLNFNRGNACKYLARAGKKGGPEKELEDLQKALWYVTREVQRLGGTVG